MKPKLLPTVTWVRKETGLGRSSLCQSWDAPGQLHQGSGAGTSLLLWHLVLSACGQGDCNSHRHPWRPVDVQRGTWDGNDAQGSYKRVV